ncbi:host-nuclease inhibitor Gam family protein [Silvimonas sp.]|uniref:host-nuclease inhibitor Gam family protein n=1 Tax=Silvimonas sp. TaxID=2650811 RepID=UPI002843A9E7|nr:host-nuclease inhibitor Gam family protein [Silvimonas sp.]MDR3427826.1 host-nuclease inhibitor Gam family protein [Silvimonas sp.]
MKKSRIKITLPNITTRDEAESVMNELALAETNKRTLTSRLDAAVLKLQDEAAVGIGECDTSIAAKVDALRAWAESHPEDFPKDRKSIVFLSGTLGFRTGTPKLALLSRAWKWEMVLNAVLARAFAFTRTTTELDKEAILAFAASEPDKEALETKVLKPIGVKVVQEESFYVEPKLTNTEVRL